jgi:hypothetical protein
MSAGLSVALCAVGCTSDQQLSNPVVIGEGFPTSPNNPAYIPLGPPDYAGVFEACIDVVDDYWEIALANRYDGRIRTFPRVAPGIEQPWRPGSPDGAERFLCTLQSYAYSCDVIIQPGEQGGYQVYVTVNKYLEDLAKPIRATAGAASFRSDNTVDRRFEVVDPDRPNNNWIPKGRDAAIEQVILKKIQDKLITIQSN